MTSLSVRFRRVAVLTLAVASTLAILGCSDDPSSPAEQEITIGGLFSLTGNWASLGVASKAAMEIAVEDVNAYLANGNTGMHFTASIKDTKLDPPTALAGITAFKEAGVENPTPRTGRDVPAGQAFDACDHGAQRPARPCSATVSRSAGRARMDRP